MAIDNSGGETPTNEELQGNPSAEGTDAVVAELAKQLEEAKQLAAQKAEEARKANYKIEADEKFTKTLTGMQDEFNKKIEGITKVLGEQLAKKDEEIKDLTNLISSHKGQTPNVSTSPQSTPPDVNAAGQKKYDMMFGIIR